jgi:hypothetical protein
MPIVEAGCAESLAQTAKADGEWNKPFMSNRGEMSSPPSAALDQGVVVATDRPAVVGTRVDAAHVPQRASAHFEPPPHAPGPASDLPAANDEAAQGCFSPDTISQLQLQAEQLAERLRLRWEDLTGREGLLNAQRAQFENELRSARLWLDERQAELAERESGLVERQAAAADREAELERRESIVAGREQGLERRRAHLAYHAERLDRRRAAVERSRAELGKAYRETLKMRMAASELLARIAATSQSPGADFTELKQRLAEHRRSEADGLEAQRAELEALRTQLAADLLRLRDRYHKSIFSDHP